MTRLRFAVLALIGAAFLAAPLSALCSSCCAAHLGENALSAPMPCCDGSCGPSLTAARTRDPAMTSPRTRFDRPLSAAVLQLPAIGLPVVISFLTVTTPVAPTESPPASSSVLRL